MYELPGYTPEGTAPAKPGLTLEQLQKAFHNWLVDEYMQRTNDETKQTPFVRWSQRHEVPRMPESLDQLHMLLMSISDSRLVRNTGIHILNNRYFSTELQQGYLRESVLVRYDPADVSQIFVFHQNKFVCIATCAELSDTRPSYQEVQRAKSRRKRYLRSIISSAYEVVKSHSRQSSREIPPVEPASPSNNQDKQITIRRYPVDA